MQGTPCLYGFITTMGPKMTADIVLNSLTPHEMSEAVAKAASEAVENGTLVALLRSPYGHYGSIVRVAADHIEALHAKIKRLEAVQS